METICALTHSFGTLLLQHGAGKTNSRYSFSTTHKFMPFASVARAKPSDADDLEIAYQLDKSAQKINLNGEVYCNGGSQPYLFQAVRKSMISVVCSCSDMACVTWQQQQPLGNPRFIRAANELILTKESPALKDKRVLGIQTRSSLEALRLAAEFLREKVNCNTCMLAYPHSQQYEQIFKRAGFMCSNYNYFCEDKGEINIYGLVADLLAAPELSVVLLDVCTQNPTSLTPSIDEWKLIAHIVKCKKMIPLFHLESHGIASGDLSQDTWPVRYFADCGFDFICAQSFVQNFGLYNESLGQLMIVAGNKTQLQTIRSQFEGMLLDHGRQCSSTLASRVVTKILNDQRLHRDWTTSLKDVYQSLQHMRLALCNKLQILKTPGNWEHLKLQRGPHLYINLKQPQLMQLRNRHVYVPSNGRINVGALREDNVSHVAEAINDVMSRAKKEDLTRMDTALQAMQQFQAA